MMNGSMFVLTADCLEAAEEVARSDVYAVSGVWDMDTVSDSVSAVFFILYKVL